MATKTVTIEEHSAYIDVQDPSGSVTRYFPINRIFDVIGAKELSEKQLNALRLLMANPYIAGTDENGNNKMYRLEVNNGILYISDEIADPGTNIAKTTEFQEYMNIVKTLFQ